MTHEQFLIDRFKIKIHSNGKVTRLQDCSRRMVEQAVLNIKEGYLDGKYLEVCEMELAFRAEIEKSPLVEALK